MTYYQINKILDFNNAIIPKYQMAEMQKYKKAKSENTKMHTFGHAENANCFMRLGKRCK